MLKRLALVIAATLVFALPHSAEARFPLGGNPAPPPPSAPVLTNAVVTFGASTPSGRGAGVRLSGMDQTIPAYQPKTAYGLDLMTASGPACDTWVSFTFVSNTSGRTGSDFNVIGSNTPEGSGAIAPTTSGTGANHLAGDYVWNVQCSAAGVLSNVATLTYHTVANISTVGPTDNFTFGWAPTNFGSVAGAKVCLATGGDFHRLNVVLRGVTLGSTPSQYLTFTVCDSPSYPYVSNFVLGALSNTLMSDVLLVGNTDVALNVATSIVGSKLISGVGSTNNTWDNLHYYGSVFMYPSTSSNSGQVFFGTACTSGCVFSNSSADFVNTGFNITDGLHASNIDIGHYSNNCLGMGGMSSGATVDNFMVCHDGLISVSGQHTDCLQFFDGATSGGLTANNLWCIQAGAVGYPQGPFFGGGQFGSKNKLVMGYIASGVLNITSGGGLYSSSSSSQIWIPSGGASIADNVHIFGSPGQTANITTSAPNTLNVGSAGSPVAIYNVGNCNLQMEGIVDTNAGFNGFASNGECGTSFLRHAGYSQQQINPVASTTFTGTINGVVGPYPSGTTVTVAGAGTSSDPGVYEPFIAGQLAYSGCTTCNSTTGTAVGGEAYSNESAQATGMATFSVSGSRGFMTITGPCTGRWDYNVANGSHLGGLMVSGSGIPDYLYVIPQLFLPSDGCAGTYQLNANYAGTITTPVAVTGKPQQGAGVYGLYNTTAVPGGPFAMTTTPFFNVSAGSGASIQQTESSGSPYCVAGLHTGAFNVDKSYATFISLCGAPVTNTTLTNSVSGPVAADFATGALPYTTLSAITVSTWNAMTTAQKIATTCNAMLPAVGHSLDLGGGSYIGPLTATGEVQLAGGNVAVPGCGIH